MGQKKYDFDMCMHGLVSSDHLGEAPAKKPTRVWSNCWSILELIEVKCDGSHRHVPLVQNRAAKAAKYTGIFVDRILDGLLIHKGAMAEGDEQLHHLADMCDSGDGVDYMSDGWAIQNAVPDEGKKLWRAKEMDTMKAMKV